MARHLSPGSLRGATQVQSRTGSGVCTGPHARLREWTCVRVTVTCALCAWRAVTCVPACACTVRTTGFTKLLKFLLRAQRGAGPHPKPHSTGASALWPVRLWFWFSSHSPCLQLLAADALPVRKETPSAAERSSVRKPAARPPAVAAHTSHTGRRSVSLGFSVLLE